VAFLNQQDDEEQKALAGSAAPQLSGSSALGAGGAAASKPGAPASSGRYVNLQKYLNANQDQGKQMGQAVIGDVANDGQNATTAINAYSANKPTETKAYTSTDLNTEFYDNPDVGKKDQYASLKTTGGYSGPSDATAVTGYQDASNKTNKAYDKVSKLTNTQGQQDLLSSYYNRPDYNAGSQRLDQTLFGRNDTVKKDAQDTYERFQGIQKLLNSQTNDVSNRIAGNTKAAQANKELIPVAEQQTWADLVNPISERAAAKTSENSAAVNNMNADIQDWETTGNQLDAETLAALGVNELAIDQTPVAGGGAFEKITKPRTDRQIFDVNLQNYLNNSQMPLGVNDVATDAERSRYNNLLAMLADQTRAALDANAPQSAPLFDKNKFQSDVAKRSTEFNNERSALQQQITDMKTRQEQIAEAFRQQNQQSGAPYSGQINDPEYAALNAEIANRENQINALGTKYKTNRRIG
jgi:hypothetical protein